jgi:hypothetical protein
MQEESGQQLQQAPLKTSKCHVQMCSSYLALPQFKETPRRSLELLVIGTLQHMNVRGSGCCFYHIALTRLLLTVKDLRAGTQDFPGCMSHFTPHRGYQCKQCLCLNDSDDDTDSEDCHGEARSESEECIVCGSRERLDPSSSDLADDADCSSGMSLEKNKIL